MNNINIINPVRVVAEIGTNHGGDLTLALEMINAAKEAGFDAVKFQKRSPDISTPKAMRTQIRTTPWGDMTYLDYRKAVELHASDYDRISEECERINIDWSASVWDIPSCGFMKARNPKWIKIPSAKSQCWDIVKYCQVHFPEVWISTGGLNWEETQTLWGTYNDPFDNGRMGLSKMVLFYTRAEYPTSDERANLSVLPHLQEITHDRYAIGYSGRDMNLNSGAIAVAYGATVVEKHFTTDPTMYGSDQKISLCPKSATEYIQRLRETELLIGTPDKEPSECERLKLAELNEPNDR